MIKTISKLKENRTSLTNKEYLLKKSLQPTYTSQKFLTKIINKDRMLSLTMPALKALAYMLGTALPGFRGCNLPWLRLSQNWDHKPLRRQSLSPWQVCQTLPTSPCLALSVTSQPMTSKNPQGRINLRQALVTRNKLAGKDLGGCGKRGWRTFTPQL